MYVHCTFDQNSNSFCFTALPYSFLSKYVHFSSKDNLPDLAMSMTLQNSNFKARHTNVSLTHFSAIAKYVTRSPDH